MCNPKLKDGVLVFKYCLRCKRIHIVGRWQKITDHIEVHLIRNFGKWDSELTVCKSCQKEDNDDKGDVADLF